VLVLVPFICNVVVALTVGAASVPENVGFDKSAFNAKLLIVA
jgi:hypothetical protein